MSLALRSASMLVCAVPVAAVVYPGNSTITHEPLSSSLRLMFRDGDSLSARISVPASTVVSPLTLSFLPLRLRTTGGAPPPKPPLPPARPRPPAAAGPPAAPGAPGSARSTTTSGSARAASSATCAATAKTSATWGANLHAPHIALTHGSVPVRLDLTVFRIVRDPVVNHDIGIGDAAGRPVDIVEHRAIPACKPSEFTGEGPAAILRRWEIHRLGIFEFQALTSLLVLMGKLVYSRYEIAPVLRVALSTKLTNLVLITWCVKS